MENDYLKHYCRTRFKIYASVLSFFIPLQARMLPVSRNNLYPHIIWSPFRYSVFRLIRPEQSERVERSPPCKRIPHEPYEMIRLEK